MFSKLKLFAGAVAVVALASTALAGPAMASVKVTTEPATEVKANSAVLNATLEAYGTETLVGFEIGTKKESGEGPGGQVVKPYEPVHISTKVTGLQPQTTYYFRAVAYGGGTTSYGEYLSFTTPKLKGFSVNTSTFKFQALTYPATVSGSPLSPVTLTMAGGTNATCTGGQFTSSLTEDVKTLLLTPALSGCEFLEEAATVKPNSCSLSLTTGTVGFGSIGVSCVNPGDAIEIATEACTLRIGQQAASSIFAWSNQGSGEGSTVLLEGMRKLSFSKQGPLCFLVKDTSGQFEFETRLAQTA